MRKLFLHVGVHRTGTTSTQRVLRDNFAGLLQRGYMYPHGVARHDELVRRLRRGQLSAEDLAADLTQRADAHPYPIDNVILSDEDMSMIRDFSIFEPLTRHFEVKVVSLLRRQDLWLESWYLQNVKWQWNKEVGNLSFDAFMARRAEFFWIDYAERFAHYESLFGPGSVLPGVFEKAEMPDGPTAAVLRLMGIADPSFTGPEVHHNSSLSPLMSEFVRHLPLHALCEHDRWHFEVAAMAADKGLGLNGSKLMLSHEERAAILAEHAAGNALVARRWLGREGLFSEALPPADASLAKRHLPQDTGALMQDFVVPMMMALGRQIKIQRERSEAMQRDLEAARRALGEGKMTPPQPQSRAQPQTQPQTQTERA